MTKFIFIMLMLFSAIYAHADVVVIGHPSNGNQLTKDDVSRIFLGKKSSFPDGSNATPFYLVAGVPAREKFDVDVLGKNSAQLKSYWSKLVFTGKGTPPEELPSVADVLKKVAADTSAVAYVESSAVNSSVKVLFKP